MLRQRLSQWLAWIRTLRMLVGITADEGKESASGTCLLGLELFPSSYAPWDCDKVFKIALPFFQNLPSRRKVREYALSSWTLS